MMCAQKKLFKQTILPIFSILHNYSFVGVHESVVIYSVFHFKSLHSVLLGISR